MYILRVDVNKPQGEFLPVFLGPSDDGNDTRSVWPRTPEGRERKDAQKDLLDSVRKREKHIPLREKGTCLQEKWLY